MYSVGKTHLFSVDAETDDLYGEPFAFGVSVWDLEKQQVVSYLGGFAELNNVYSEWCKENICQHLEGKWRDNFVKFETKLEMRNIFWNYYMQWRDKSIILADFQYPCEDGLFRQCVLDNHDEREWLGPYPMMDLGTILGCANMDPDLDRFKYTGYNNLDKHNPIHDSMTAGKIYFIVTDGINEKLNQKSFR